jgi:hypothetical protein
MMKGMEDDMKSRQWMKAILALVVLVWIAGFQGTGRGEWIGDVLIQDDYQENPLEGGHPFSALLGSMATTRLRMPSYFDPRFSGGLEAALGPSLDLIHRESYSLKLTMPVSWDQGLYAAPDQGGTFSAGLFATIRFKALPARYGSWSLSTGLFLIRKDPGLMDETLPGDFEGLGRIGTVNISISY